ncbi:MAG: hypothetical protein IIX27_00360 [Ruminococcus sp.]|nr:hypothetical protein [Ruminococcus sp.]
MANNEQINALINQLSEKLNTDSKQVKDALQKGNFQQVLKNMDENQAQKINEILSDPEQSKKVLNSPYAQALIKKLMG